MYIHISSKFLVSAYFIIYFLGILRLKQHFPVILHKVHHQCYETIQHQLYCFEQCCMFAEILIVLLYLCRCLRLQNALCVEETCVSLQSHEFWLVVSSSVEASLFWCIWIEGFLAFTIIHKCGNFLELQLMF